MAAHQVTTDSSIRGGSLLPEKRDAPTDRLTSANYQLTFKSSYTGQPIGGQVNFTRYVNLTNPETGPPEV